MIRVIIYQRSGKGYIVRLFFASRSGFTKIDRDPRVVYAAIRSYKQVAHCDNMSEAIHEEARPD